MRIVEILKPYVPYVLYSIIGAILAGNIMDISQKQSVIFGLATLICFLFVDKIFLKIFNFKIKVPTIREQLMQECPKDVKAGGKIAPGNAATYEKYLFSGCEKNDTCDDAVADEISAGIINKTERCGDWNLVSTGLTYSEDKGWTKSQDCAAYTPDSSYLPDQCIKNIWEESGCTNIEAADKYYQLWKKMTKKAIGVDIKSWEHLKDNTHRGLCYGPDPTKWPQPIDCKTFGDNDLIPPICQKEIWKDVGCLTPNNGTSDWWNKQTKKVIKGDMKLWATEIDDEHRTRCYGTDKTKWPKSPTADFPTIFNIVHPNGSPWRYYATDTIKLKNGLKVRMSIYDNANVFNHILGNVALHDLQNDKYLRHANFLLHSDAFVANNGDFSWNFKKTPSGYNIYNDYGGGYYVGYDPNQDVVLIVPPGSPLIVSWKIAPAVDDERMVVGNNGTVSCDMYCNGLGGLSWNGELPADWKGAQCETAGIYQTTGCSYVGKDGSTPSGLYCTCTRNDAKPYTKNKTPWIIPLHAVELCQVGQGPWGGCPGFLGPNAKWICDLPGSDRGARVGLLGYFIYEYTNSGGPISGRFNIIVDDSSTIDVNNTVIATYGGGWGGQGGIFPVTLATGLTRFIISVTNGGGPAGFVAAMVDGNNSVLFQTDSSWIYSADRGTYNDVPTYKPAKREYLLGSGTDTKLYYMPADFSQGWTQVGQNNCCVTSMAQMNDGSFLGVGTDSYCYSKADINAAWSQVSASCCVKSAIQLKDNTFLGVGMDNTLWTKAYLTAPWIQVGPNNCCVTSIIQLHDGTFLGVGTNNWLYTKPNITGAWSQVGASNAVKSVTQLQNGTFVGVGMGNDLWYKSSLTAGWQSKGQCCVVNVVSIMM